MNYAKKVDRLIREYELADKLPMSRAELLRYRSIGRETLAEFIRRGHITVDPKQALIDIHPKLERIKHQLKDVEDLKAAITGGSFTLHKNSKIDFRGLRLRNFGAIVLKEICDKLGVPLPPVTETKSIRVPKMSCTAAHVMFCGHAGWFIADLYAVGGAVVIRANGHIMPEALIRGRNEEATHHVTDFPDIGFWRPDLGVLVVPAQQVKRLK
jgi:hypothetical protein